MSLASLARALGRSARSSRARQGFSLGGLRPPPSPPLPPVHGGEGGGLGFVRGYLTAALGSPAAGKAADWRFLLANPQFRRLFSGGSKKNYENYYPKGKKEAPKGDGSNKSDSKQDSNTDVLLIPWHNILAPLLFVGLMLSSLSSGASDQKEISFQEFKNKLLEPGLVDRIVVSNKSVAKVFVRSSPQLNSQSQNSDTHITTSDVPGKHAPSRYKYYFNILGAGTSLPGLVAAKVGADVTLTDIAHNSEVLNNIRQICGVNNANCTVCFDLEKFFLHVTSYENGFTCSP